MVGSAIPGQVVLGSILKQAGQASGSKPVISSSPWSLHQLPPPGSFPSAMLKCEPNKPFFSQLAPLSSQQ